MNIRDSSTRPSMTERKAEIARMVPEWRLFHLEHQGCSMHPTTTMYLQTYGWVSPMTMATFQGSGIPATVLGPAKRAADYDVQDTTPKRLRGA